eukprot:5433972-Prorocentrum_lima.AAC.1
MAPRSNPSCAAPTNTTVHLDPTSHPSLSTARSTDASHQASTNATLVETTGEEGFGVGEWD